MSFLKVPSIGFYKHSNNPDKTWGANLSHIKTLTSSMAMIIIIKFKY